MAAKVGPSGNGKTYPFLVPQARRGDDILAARWNQMADAINRANTGYDSPANASVAGKESGKFVRLFKILSVGVDTLSCVEAGAAEDGNNVTISKPFRLRGNEQSHGAVTFAYVSETSRTASVSGEEDETHVIVPSYEVDDLIIGIRNISGGVDLIDENGEAVQWIDLNVDARAWAKEAE